MAASAGLKGMEGPMRKATTARWLHARVLGLEIMKPPSKLTMDEAVKPPAASCCPSFRRCSRPRPDGAAGCRLPPGTTSD